MLFSHPFSFMVLTIISKVGRKEEHTLCKENSSSLLIFLSDISTYTTCMMEGMAIGYRPQSTIATVVGQCFNEMVGGKSNIPGSYWKHILGEQAPILQTLSTLGNSTRVYDHLKQTSIGLKSALSRKYSGYLSRDGMTGLAPESEDCDEAMEACLTLRDVYEPPSMGFDSDEEGYFEDNSD